MVILGGWVFLMSEVPLQRSQGLAWCADREEGGASLFAPHSTILLCGGERPLHGLSCPRREDMAKLKGLSVTLCGGTPLSLWYCLP